MKNFLWCLSFPSEQPYVAGNTHLLQIVDVSLDLNDTGLEKNINPKCKTFPRSIQFLEYNSIIIPLKVVLAILETFVPATIEEPIKDWR